MAVRSANLAVGTKSGAGITTVATVPAGETWIIKDIRTYASGGAVRALVGAARGGLLVPISDGSLPNAGSRGVECWVVLEPGDEIQVFSNSTTFDFWVSGAMLSGVA